MKKTILSVIFILMLLVTITGCKKDNKKNINGDNNVYKYIKVSSNLGRNFFEVADILFNDMSEIEYEDNYYKPCLIVEYDTNTKKANSVKVYSFYIDDNTDEWVNKAIDTYKNSTFEYKGDITNVDKKRLNDSITYLTADINPESFTFNQYVGDLIKEQNIDKYKNDIFYSRLSNYEEEPKHEESDNYFEESIENIRIEWSNEELKAY